MRRGGVGMIASSPTLVGAITTLIVILAVFLAYNANNGLPFVPSYRISVQVPNAETLVPGTTCEFPAAAAAFVEEALPFRPPNAAWPQRAAWSLARTAKRFPKGWPSS